MGVYKEIPKADGSGITTFYRLSTENATVETTSTGSTETMFDYNNVLNKPSINDVVLIGNKTSADLGLQPAGNYITEIPEEYVTESELEAKDYATEAYVLEQINNTEHFHREIVDALPLTGKDNVLYLVAKKGTDKDIYNEYIWTGTDYEFLGTTAADLSDYYKKSEVDDLIGARVKKETGKGLSTNDYTTAEKTKLASLENYDDSEIKSQLNQLHNYDDTEIKEDITALETVDTEINNDITELKKKVIKKIEYIRLVKSGDSWTWMNVLGDNLTFSTVRNLLGLENTFLIIEDIENDGKMIPARYDIDETLIKVWYTDISGENYQITLSENPEDLDSLGIQTHLIPSADSLPTTGKKGDMICIGANKDWYIYDGSAWIAFDKAMEIDLSNYLAKNNTIAYSPATAYNPATKKYVDDSIADIFIPTKVSQLTNDSGFVLKTTNDLTNYYNKSNTYNKAEVNALVAGGGGSSVDITLNGVSTTSPSFYAPINGGTSGQVLTSNGSSAPTWGTLSYNEITGTPSLSTVATSGNYNDLSNKPSLASVATSGSYNDLTNKPTIPTKTSDLTNDSNYTTLYSVENNYADGTTICGWSSSATDGENMTSQYGMTPSEAASIMAGKKYEWQSRVSFSGMNYAVCYYASHDHGTADDGTSYNYVSAKIGNGTDWISFCWDDTTVYFGSTWPDTSGGHACFAGDTLVWTPEGEKKIKDIQIGDKVMSINIEKDVIEPREITKLVNHEEEEILVITTKDDTIKVTGSHPFYEKKKGKVNARILEVGDELMDDKFGLHKITKIETKAFNDTVYEIVVDGTHNYFVGKKHIRVFNEPSVLKD